MACQILSKVATTVIPSSTVRRSIQRYRGGIQSTTRVIYGWVTNKQLYKSTNAAHQPNEDEDAEVNGFQQSFKKLGSFVVEGGH